MTTKRLKTRNAGREFETGMWNDKALKVLLAMTFDLENRIRALEGRPVITEEYAREALKARFAQ